MITEVQFGQWLPDAPDYKNPGLTVAENCYPVPGGYGPFLGPVGTGTTISGEIRGAIKIEKTDGNIAFVIGTDTDLYLIQGGVVTASNLSLTVSDDVYWSFERFNDQIWAFAYNEVPHYLPDLDADTAFVPHPGAAPKARSVNRVGDFIVTANMVDIDTTTAPYRLRWSQFNNPAGDFGTDIGTQSGFVDLPRKFGPAVGVFGGRSDVVLQKYGIHRLTYTGGATAFRLDVIEEERGCVSQASVVTVGANVYFLSNDGFCRTDGANVEIISDARVWRWFRENSDVSSLTRVQGAVDWPNRCVVWNFEASNGAGYFDQLIYSFEHQRWSTAKLNNQWLFSTVEPGVSLEELGTEYGALEDIPLSLDSPEYKAKDRALASVVSGQISNLSGDTLSARFETGEFQPKAGFRACTQLVAPLVENDEQNTTCAIGARDAFKGGPVRWSANTSVGGSGFAPIIADGKYLRARVTVPAGTSWRSAVGLQVEFVATGRV